MLYCGPRTNYGGIDGCRGPTVDGDVCLWRDSHSLFHHHHQRDRHRQCSCSSCSSPGPGSRSAGMYFNIKGPDAAASSQEEGKAAAATATVRPRTLSITASHCLDRRPRGRKSGETAPHQSMHVVLGRSKRTQSSDTTPSLSSRGGGVAPVEATSMRRMRRQQESPRGETTASATAVGAVTCCDSGHAKPSALTASDGHSPGITRPQVLQQCLCLVRSAFHFLGVAFFVERRRVDVLYVELFWPDDETISLRLCDPPLMRRSLQQRMEIH